MRRLGIVAVGLALCAMLLLTASCAGNNRGEKAESPTPPNPTPQPTVRTEEPTQTSEPTIGLHGLWAYCQETWTTPAFGEVETLELAGGYNYRCYEGKPFYCIPGATGGACMQLEYNNTEPPELADWCREHPVGVQKPPFVIMGHGPKMYDWFCFNGWPSSSLSDFDPQDYDDMGFSIASWEAIPEPQAVETPVPPPPQDSSFAQPPPVTGSCEGSYPDVCLPRSPPDLDCRHIPFRDFRVLPPDPHHFDVDGDGIGCEWP